MRAYQLRITMKKLDTTTITEIREDIAEAGKLKKVEPFIEQTQTQKIIYVDRYFLSTNYKTLKEKLQEYEKRYMFYEGDLKEIVVSDEVLEVE